MSEDLDQVGDTIFQLGLNVPNEVYSQEFLLTSKPGPKLQWTAGLFYFNNRDTYDVSYNKYPAFGVVAPVLHAGGSSTKTQSYAAFLDATYEVSPQFFVTAGVRYAHDTVTDAYYISPFSFTKTPVPSLKANRVTPRVVLRYKPNDQSSIYASYTRGYKAGVIDVGGASSNRVKPETIDAFEVGYKYSDRALSFEAAGYYYKYKNLQVSLFKQATAQLVNAATSEIYGAEGQVRYDFDEHFQVNLGASWTHARYTDFPEAPVYTRCPTAAGCGFGTSFFILPTNLKDVHMQRSPDFTGNIGARYRTTVAEGELVLSGNLYYTSKFYYSPSGTQFPQNGYEVLTLRAQWTDPSDHYSLAVFGDNVTNSRYRTQVQYNNFGIGATWSAPVTYGVEVGVKF
jgi:iron complex outermembrane receptor protein